MGKANQKFAFIKGAFIQRCSVNKLFFKISQNYRKSPVPNSNSCHDLSLQIY